ncbi:hypothetical protein KDW67_34005 [Burkholderia cenocepacia]|uniref:hypothetical protein n=1 Tax=Burkholderia cenocepacia TaxID=95486 RepID=UPI00097C6F31|nr:hypothetical protein [Burkholderia cenocepacia]AQQ46769.1 hypothetical protein A8F32_13310 [Burkholderia cenocepacia]MBR8264992.1 hypothetical protein [Burkholderia cenocepacia]ONJ01625.1 hypothetical protein A8F53_16610 [Burkholderia cenocepacia]ONJ33953.1 hypothetical protein A8F38_07570 [Burkholderia cenocepacia]ONY68519.1 hypothetical protein A8F35_24535 [Burkholderia cenocepacia]
MAIEIYANNASTTLALAVPAAGVGSGQVSLTSGTGSLFPQPGPALYPPGETTFFRLSLTDATTQTKREVLYVTGRVGDNLTVLRGQEGTSAQQWNAGDIAFNSNTAGTEGVQVQVTQLQSGYLTAVAASGSTTAVAAQLPINGLTALNAGISLNVLIPSTNSGPYTFNLNNFGVRNVVDDMGNPLDAGYLVGGVTYPFRYDGQRWVVSSGNSKARALYVDDTAPGSAPNGLIVNTGLGLTSLSRGFRIYVRAANTNSTGITLKVDNLPPIPAVASDGNAIQATGVRQGGTYRFLFDGQRFVTDITNNQSFPIGTILDFYGNPADIPTKYGPGWQVADGTNGSPDLRDRMTIGAGLSYTQGSTGGTTTQALTVANMPAHSHAASQQPHAHHIAFDHSHGVNDPGHAHSMWQTPHGHGVSDPGHAHSYHVIAQAVDDGGSNALTGGGRNTSWDGQFDGWTDGSGTGIWIQANNANVGVNGAGTGVSVQNTHVEIDTWGANANITIGNTGNGAQFSIQNPYYAVFKIIRLS